MTKNPKKNQCKWIHKPNRTENGVYMSAEYCGAPVRYRMLKDDDENRVRTYENFCPEHKAIADTMPEDDWS